MTTFVWVTFAGEDHNKNDSRQQNSAVMQANYGLTFTQTDHTVVLSRNPTNLNGESFKRYKLCVGQDANAAYPDCNATYMGDKYSMNWYETKKSGGNGAYYRICSITHGTSNYQQGRYCSDAVRVDYTNTTSTQPSTTPTTTTTSPTSTSTPALNSAMKARLDIMMDTFVEKINERFEDDVDGKVTMMENIVNRLETMKSSRPSMMAVADYLIERLEEEISVMDLESLFDF